MALTKIKGNRIDNGTIEARHLSKDFKIEKENINGGIDIHSHNNLDLLEKFFASHDINKRDLYKLNNILLEMNLAKGNFNTLDECLKDKANITDLKVLQDFINSAEDVIIKDFSLKGVIDFLAEYTKKNIEAHSGTYSHEKLDILYGDYRISKGNYNTLAERLDSMPTDGGTGSGSNNNCDMNPWESIIELEEGQRVINLNEEYSTGVDSLLVFEEALLLSSGEDNDYVEDSKTSIRLNYYVPKGTKIRILGTSSNKGLFKGSQKYTVTSDDINCIEVCFTFNENNNDLLIYEDGMLLNNGDYTLKDNKIYFDYLLSKNSIINIFKKR